MNFIFSIRFKLHLLIKDYYSETKVMLLDTIAEPILGVSADVLLGGSLEEVYISLNIFKDFFNYKFVSLVLILKYIQRILLNYELVSLVL